jgi:hypothetical protein
MTKRTFLYSAFLGALYLGTAGAQYPMLDTVANKVIQKYQQSSCEQLWKQKSQPKTQMEKDFLKLLHDDPKMRAMFIDKVAGPIANRMFDCAMLP